MATSAKQIAANRRNALKSTGPKTARGKRISSRNSVKHGAYAQTVVIESPRLKESKRKYNHLFRKICTYLNPENPFQFALTREIANCVWRANRIIRAKTTLTDSIAECIMSFTADSMSTAHHIFIDKLIRFEHHLYHQHTLACRVFSYIKELQEADHDQAEKNNKNAKRTHFRNSNRASYLHVIQFTDFIKNALSPSFKLSRNYVRHACPVPGYLAQILRKGQNFRLQLPKKEVYILSAIRPP